MSPAWLAKRNSLVLQTEKLLKEHKLTGWSVNFDDALSRAGRCNHTTKTITYSKHFMLASSDEVAANTVFHEIAHAIAGPHHGHDKTWKVIFTKLGGNGKRTTELPSSLVSTEKFKWVGVCSNCNAKHGQQRSPQSVWACAACDAQAEQRLYKWFKDGEPVELAAMSAKYIEKFENLVQQGVINPKELSWLQ